METALAKFVKSDLLFTAIGELGARKRSGKNQIERSRLDGLNGR